MKTFLAAALLTAFSAPAFSQGLEVKVTGDTQQVVVSFVTTQKHSSMCRMTNHALKLVAPPAATPEMDEEPLGQIELESQALPGEICLTAIGPHRGALVLEKGKSFPKIPFGGYTLTINGEAYGTLRVTGDSATLEDKE